MTPTAYVDGVGFWAPGFGDAAAWARGVADPAVVEPPAALLAAALRRRATPLSRMVAEVAAQAAGQAGARIGETPLVFGSALGEIACATEIIASFRDEGGLPSPTRFHNSVHNTAIGYLSIATGNRLGGTAIAAGPGTSAAALLEAILVLADRGGSALLLLADEPLPTPLDRWGDYRGAAAGFCLSAVPTARTLASLSNLRPGATPRPELPGGWGGHPCAGGLALVAQLARGLGGEAGLGPWPAEGWAIDVRVGRP